MTNFVLINPFEVPEGVDDDRFLEGWGRAADFMRSQPGFVESRLHRRTSTRLLGVPSSSAGGGRASQLPGTLRGRARLLTCVRLPKGDKR